MDDGRILLDIETQRDFFEPGGNCYNDRGEAAAVQVRRLFGWAMRSRIPVISTVLRIRRHQRGPLCNCPHCQEGSPGEQKMGGTLMPSRINLGLRNTTDLPRDIFQTYQQVIFEKRYTDILAHVRIERLITELEPVRFVICGASLAGGIVQAAVGLRSRGLDVTVASDAAVSLSDPASEMACLRMAAKGVIFAPTAEIIAGRRCPARLRPSRAKQFRIGGERKRDRRHASQRSQA